MFRKKYSFERDSRPVAAMKSFFRGIWYNIWLTIFLIIGAGGGVVAGYYLTGNAGLYILALGSLLGFFGHLIDSRGS